MAFPTPPPPAVAPESTTTRPLYPPGAATNPNPQLIYTTSRPLSNPNPNYPHLAPRYPSPGRGFIARPAPRRPFMFSYPDPNPFFFRPLNTPGIHISSSQQQQQQQQLKVAGPSILDTNAKQLRDRNRDDVSVIIRDRKVRVHNNASLYSLCRSWLRNGFPEEAQPQYLDAVKALPKPLPLAAEAVNSPDKKEGDKEEGDEDEGYVEHLSTKELLHRHVKRAKRIRSRLREERHERITRYKTRLALLLPPMVDQSPLKNEIN